MSRYPFQTNILTENPYNSINSYPTFNPDRNSSRNESNRIDTYGNSIFYPESITFTNTDYQIISSPPRPIKTEKFKDFRKKVHDVINLCNVENSQVKGELSQTIQQQRQIRDMLSESHPAIQRIQSHQIMPQTYPNLSHNFSYQKIHSRNLPETPKQYIKQNPQLEIPKFSHIIAKQNDQPPNISRSKRLRSELGNQQRQQLSQNALRLIEEIRRKDFEEIEKLKRQKIELMQRLDKEIKTVNQERKRNAYLSNLLNTSTIKPQNPNKSLYESRQSTQYLQAQIARLETELKRVSQLNNNLRQQLSTTPLGAPGVQQLFHQGELIRQKTQKMLQMKQQENFQQKIQELQRRLVTEQTQKQKVLSQLKTLKEIYGDGVKNRRVVKKVGFQSSFASKTFSPKQRNIFEQYRDPVPSIKNGYGK